MNLKKKEIEEWISSFWARPFRTLIIVLVVVVILVGLTLIQSYFGEKGKQLAIAPNKDVGTATGTKEAAVEKKTENDRTIIIEQHTQGDQSPAIVGEKIELKYDGRKDEKKKE